MTTPPSLHNALRRVIATTADPDDGAQNGVPFMTEAYV